MKRMLTVLLTLLLYPGVALADEVSGRTLKDIPRSDLLLMLKGYPGDWREDTGQHRGLPEPVNEKPVSADAKRIPLTTSGALEGNKSISLSAALEHRRSTRAFSDDALSVDDLSFLLWLSLIHI